MSSLRKSKTPKVDTLLAALNPYLPPASQQFPHVLRDRCSYPFFAQAEAHEPKTHQLISSIAALCAYDTPPTPEGLEVVHSDKNPVVAVALEVTPDSSKQVNIYLATNHAPPPQLTRHVAACLRHIKKLHQIAREKTSSSHFPSSEIDTAIENEFLEYSYRFSFGKIRSRIQKQDRCRILAERLGEALKTIRYNEATTTTLDEILFALNELLAIVEQERSGFITINAIRDFHNAGTLLSITLANIMEERGEVYRELDSIVIKDRSAFHIFEKACYLPRALHNLVSTVMSASMRDINMHTTTAIWVRPSPAKSFVSSLDPDLFQIWFMDPPSKNSWPEIISRAQKKPPAGLTRIDHNFYSKQSTVHSECLLVAYLLENQIPVYPFIGCTKLSCYACTMYIQAVNQTFQSHLQPFAVKGSHGKLYLPWSCPDIASAASGQKGITLGKCLEENLLQDLRVVVKHTSPHASDTSNDSSRPFTSSLVAKLSMKMRARHAERTHSAREAVQVLHILPSAGSFSRLRTTYHLTRFLHQQN